MPAEPSSSPEGAPETQTAEPTAEVRATGWQSGPLRGVIGALAASFIVWIFLETIHPVFWTTEGMDEWGFLPPETQWRLDRNNTMLVVGLLAGLTAAGMGLAEGTLRRSKKTAVMGVLGWTLIAALFGALGGFLGHRTFEYFGNQQEMGELYQAMIVTGVMLGLVGMGVGLGACVFLGFGPRRILSCMSAGLLAGVLAALIYPFVVAALLPGVMTSVLLPVEPVARLLWVEFPAGILGLAIPRVARKCQPH